MSKLLLFDFRCTKCAAITESMVKPGQYWVACSECGGNAQRILSPVRVNHYKMAISESASPASIRHFDRQHQQQKAKEEKTYRDHGDYGKAAGSD